MYTHNSLIHNGSRRKEDIKIRIKRKRTIQEGHCPQKRGQRRAGNFREDNKIKRRTCPPKRTSGWPICNCNQVTEERSGHAPIACAASRKQTFQDWMNMELVADSQRNYHRKERVLKLDGG